MIVMKAIAHLPKTAAQNQVLRKAWRDALREEKDDIRAAYRKTYSNWSHKPAEQTTVKVRPDEMYAEVKLVGRIYWFVHESISVLRAVFSGPNDPAGKWKAKTEPRKLASGAGSGRMLYASKKIAKPPYKAREFTDAIIEERVEKFNKRMRDATKEGVKAALGG